MATKEEEPKEVQEGKNENPEEKEEEEEEPVDLELQKEMKGLTISDSDFKKEPKAKKTQKKPKDPTIKKNKKKGQDFLDYANQNNIQINFEYEENKYQLKKTDDAKNQKNNKYQDKKPYNKNNKKNWQNKKPKLSGNKFDMVGYRQYPHYNFQPQNTVQLSDDKQIIEHLEKLFSEESLNKDLYIRNRISNGKIEVENLAKYNDFKNNNIDAQKIIDLSKNCKNLEIMNEDGKNYIKIKDFDETKLMTIQQILESKRNQKNSKMQFNNAGNQPYPPIMSFQNNFYFYGAGMQPYQPYYNPGAYMYQGNK